MPLNPPAPDRRPSLEQRAHRLGVHPAFILGQLVGAGLVLIAVLLTR